VICINTTSKKYRLIFRHQNL